MRPDQVQPAKLSPSLTPPPVALHFVNFCFQDQGELSLWFMFQKTKYLFDGVEKKQFVAVSFPVSESVQTYLDWKGYQDDEEVKHAENKFGKNM